MRLLLAAAIGSMMFGGTLSAGAQSREAPRFDPFVPAVGGVAGARNNVWSPELRSTLVGARSSIANLGGEILRIGEETHGYTLLEVHRSEAVFNKDGQRLVLKLVEKSQP